MEACASSHYWGRELSRIGHEVRLIPPAYVKPFVKRQKNDAADAEAICEASQRPMMRFVQIKSETAQAAAVVFRARDLLVRQRTQIINALRGHLAEFGLVVRDAGQIHLDQGLLDRTLPPPVTLDDRRLERLRAKLGYPQLDLAGLGLQLAFVVAGPGIATGLATMVLKNGKLLFRAMKRRHTTAKKHSRLCCCHTFARWRWLPARQRSIEGASVRSTLICSRAPGPRSA